MVRETRHLWVGNLPDNIREERILEHFKRYGKVQSVKILTKKEEESCNGGANLAVGACATVAFIDIKSAAKAHNAENKIEERTLKTDYYEPPVNSTATSAIYIHERDDSLGRPAGASYSTNRPTRYPIGLQEDRSYDRSGYYYDRTPSGERDNYVRRSLGIGYHDDEAYQVRGRSRDRYIRNANSGSSGVYQDNNERNQNHFGGHRNRQHFDQQRYPSAGGSDQYQTPAAPEERENPTPRISANAVASAATRRPSVTVPTVTSTVTSPPHVNNNNNNNNNGAVNNSSGALNINNSTANSGISGTTTGGGIARQQRRVKKTSAGSRSPSCSRSNSHSRSRSSSRSSNASRSSSASSSKLRSSSSDSSSRSRSPSKSRSPAASHCSQSSGKSGRVGDRPASAITGGQTPALVPFLPSTVTTPVGPMVSSSNGGNNNGSGIVMVASQVSLPPSSNINSLSCSSLVSLSQLVENNCCDKDDKRPLGICVRNLPVRSTDTSLKDGLFHEYKKHGKVTMVKVIGQGLDRYAVVCFKKPEDVDKALEVSKDKLFFGCKIEVTAHEGLDGEDNEFRPLEADLDEFHPKATRTLFIGNLEKDITTAELRKHFELFGEIIDIDIKKQGSASSYAFIQYSDIGSVVKAMRKLDGENLGTNRIKLGFGKSMPTNCVWLDGVTDAIPEKFLARHFNRFGPVNYTAADRERGHALVYYETTEYAQIAVSEMRGRVLGGKRLQVDYASRECQQAFFEKLEMTGQMISTERPWERRDRREFEVIRDEREPRVGFENRTYPRYENQQQRPARGGNFRGTVQRGTFSNRGRGAQNFPARYELYHDEFVERRIRNYDEEFSQGSGASFEDSYEQELREYGYSQRERREYGSGEERLGERGVRGRSFSPLRRRDSGSVSPNSRERHKDERSNSPHLRSSLDSRSNSLRMGEKHDDLFNLKERYIRGEELEDGFEDKDRCKIESLERIARKRNKHLGLTGEGEDLHSQSPPRSRHQSRSQSPTLQTKDRRNSRELHHLRSPSNSQCSSRVTSPSRENDAPETAMDYAEHKDSQKRKMDNKIDLRDSLLSLKSNVSLSDMVAHSRCERKNSERLEALDARHPDSLVNLSGLSERKKRLLAMSGTPLGNIGRGDYHESSIHSRLKLGAPTMDSVILSGRTLCDNDIDRDEKHSRSLDSRSESISQKKHGHITRLLNHLEEKGSSLKCVSLNDHSLDSDKVCLKRAKISVRDLSPPTELLASTKENSVSHSKDSKELPHQRHPVVTITELCPEQNVAYNFPTTLKFVDVSATSAARKQVSDPRSKPGDSHHGLPHFIPQRIKKHPELLDDHSSMDTSDKDHDHLLTIGNAWRKSTLQHPTFRRDETEGANQDKLGLPPFGTQLVNEVSSTSDSIPQNRHTKARSLSDGTPEPKKERDLSPLSLPLPKFAASLRTPKASPNPLSSPRPSAGSPAETTSPKTAFIEKNTSFPSEDKSEKPQELLPVTIADLVPEIDPKLEALTVNTDLKESDTPLADISSPILSPKISAKEMEPQSASEPEEPSEPTTEKPSIEERIRALDEKYNAWSGSTRSFSSSLSGDSPTTPACPIDYQKYNIKRRPRFNFLTSDMRTEPSEIMKSLLAKSTIFDQDSKRLQHINEKYEPKEVKIDSSPRTRPSFRTKAEAKEFSLPIQLNNSAIPTFVNTLTPSSGSGSTNTIPTVVEQLQCSPTTLQSSHSTSNKIVSEVTTPSTTPVTILTATAVPLSKFVENSKSIPSSKEANSSKPETVKLTIDTNTHSLIPATAIKKEALSPIREELDTRKETKEKIVLPSFVSPVKDLNIKKEPNSAVREHISSAHVKKEKEGHRKEQQSKSSSHRKDEHSNTKDMNLENSRRSSVSDNHSKDSNKEKRERDTFVGNHCSVDTTPLYNSNPKLKRRMPSLDSSESDSGKSSKSLEQQPMETCEIWQRNDGHHSERNYEPDVKKQKLIGHSKDHDKDKRSNEREQSLSPLPTLSKKSSSDRKDRSFNSNKSDKYNRINKHDSHSSHNNDREELSKSNDHKMRSKHDSQRNKDEKRNKSKDGRERDNKSEHRSEKSSSSSSKSKYTIEGKTMDKDSQSSHSSGGSSNNPKSSSSKKESSNHSGIHGGDRDKKYEKKSSSAGGEKTKQESSAKKGSGKRRSKTKSSFWGDAEPVYFSMYDKVKARSSQNQTLKIQQKDLESVRQKFNQLKQSRAKKEEKSKSADQDSDRDSDFMSQHSSDSDGKSKSPSSVRNKQMKKKKLIIQSSSDDDDDRPSQDLFFGDITSKHNKSRHTSGSCSDSDQDICTLSNSLPKSKLNKSDVYDLDSSDQEEITPLRYMARKKQNHQRPPLEKTHKLKLVKSDMDSSDNDIFPSKTMHSPPMMTSSLSSKKREHRKKKSSKKDKPQEIKSDFEISSEETSKKESSKKNKLPSTQRDSLPPKEEIKEVVFTTERLSPTENKLEKPDVDIDSRNHKNGDSKDSSKQKLLSKKKKKSKKATKLKDKKPHSKSSSQDINKKDDSEKEKRCSIEDEEFSIDSKDIAKQKSLSPPCLQSNALSDNDFKTDFSDYDFDNQRSLDKEHSGTFWPSSNMKIDFDAETSRCESSSVVSRHNKDYHQEKPKVILENNRLSNNDKFAEDFTEPIEMNISKDLFKSKDVIKNYSPANDLLSSDEDNRLYDDISCMKPSESEHSEEESFAELKVCEPEEVEIEEKRKKRKQNKEKRKRKDIAPQDLQKEPIHSDNDPICSPNFFDKLISSKDDGDSKHSDDLRLDAEIAEEARRLEEELMAASEETSNFVDLEGPCKRDLKLQERRFEEEAAKETRRLEEELFMSTQSHWHLKDDKHYCDDVSNSNNLIEDILEKETKCEEETHLIIKEAIYTGLNLGSPLEIDTSQQNPEDFLIDHVDEEDPFQLEKEGSPYEIDNERKMEDDLAVSALLQEMNYDIPPELPKESEFLEPILDQHSEDALSYLLDEQQDTLVAQEPVPELCPESLEELKSSCANSLFNESDLTATVAPTLALPPPCTVAETPVITELQHFHINKLKESNNSETGFNINYHLPESILSASEVSNPLDSVKIDSEKIIKNNIPEMDQVANLPVELLLPPSAPEPEREVILPQSPISKLQVSELPVPELLPVPESPEAEVIPPLPDFHDSELTTPNLQDLPVREPSSSTLPAPELQLPEISIPDLPVPELSVPELPVPELSVPELPVPELSVPELPVPELSVPELQVSDLSIVELSVPDLSIPELPVPELSVPELPVPELCVPDLPVPELSVPELPVPELSVPELPVPELPVPELPVQELHVSGLAMTDFNMQGLDTESDLVKSESRKNKKKKRKDSKAKQDLRDDLFDQQDIQKDLADSFLNLNEVMNVPTSVLHDTPPQSSTVLKINNEKCDILSDESSKCLTDPTCRVIRGFPEKPSVKELKETYLNKVNEVIFNTQYPESEFDRYKESTESCKNVSGVSDLSLENDFLNTNSPVGDQGSEETEVELEDTNSEMNEDSYNTPKRSISIEKPSESVLVKENSPTEEQCRRELSVVVNTLRNESDIKAFKQSLYTEFPKESHKIKTKLESDMEELKPLSISIELTETRRPERPKRGRRPKTRKQQDSYFDSVTNETTTPIAPQRTSSRRPRQQASERCRRSLRSDPHALLSPPELSNTGSNDDSHLNDKFDNETQELNHASGDVNFGKLDNSDSSADKVDEDVHNDSRVTEEVSNENFVDLANMSAQREEPKRKRGRKKKMSGDRQSIQLSSPQSIGHVVEKADQKAEDIDLSKDSHRLKESRLWLSISSVDKAVEQKPVSVPKSNVYDVFEFRDSEDEEVTFEKNMPPSNKDRLIDTCRPSHSHETKHHESKQHETKHHETKHHESKHHETKHHETKHHETKHHEVKHHEIKHHETKHHESKHHESKHHENKHHEVKHEVKHHEIKPESKHHEVKHESKLSEASHEKEIKKHDEFKHGKPLEENKEITAKEYVTELSQHGKISITIRLHQRDGTDGNGSSTAEVVKTSEAVSMDDTKLESLRHEKNSPKLEQSSPPEALQVQAGRPTRKSSRLTAQVSKTSIDEVIEDVVKGNFKISEEGSGLNEPTPARATRRTRASRRSEEALTRLGEDNVGDLQSQNSKNKNDPIFIIPDNKIKDQVEVCKPVSFQTSPQETLPCDSDLPKPESKPSSLRYYRIARTTPRSEMSKDNNILSPPSSQEAHIGGSLKPTSGDEGNSPSINNSQLSPRNVPIQPDISLPCANSLPVMKVELPHLPAPRTKSKENVGNTEKGEIDDDSDSRSSPTELLDPVTGILTPVNKKGEPKGTGKIEGLKPPHVSIGEPSSVITKLSMTSSSPVTNSVSITTAVSVIPTSVPPPTIINKLKPLIELSVTTKSALPPATVRSTIATLPPSSKLTAVIKDSSCLPPPLALSKPVSVVTTYASAVASTVAPKLIDSKSTPSSVIDCRLASKEVLPKSTIREVPPKTHSMGVLMTTSSSSLPPPLTKTIQPLGPPTATNITTNMQSHSTPTLSQSIPNKMPMQLGQPPLLSPVPGWAHGSSPYHPAFSPHVVVDNSYVSKVGKPSSAQTVVCHSGVRTVTSVPPSPISVAHSRNVAALASIENSSQMAAGKHHHSMITNANTISISGSNHPNRMETNVITSGSKEREHNMPKPPVAHSSIGHGHRNPSPGMETRPITPGEINTGIIQTGGPRVKISHSERNRGPPSYQSEQTSRHHSHQFPINSAPPNIPSSMQIQQAHSSKHGPASNEGLGAHMVPGMVVDSKGTHLQVSKHSPTFLGQSGFSLPNFDPAHANASGNPPGGVIAELLQNPHYLHKDLIAVAAASGSPFSERVSNQMVRPTTPSSASGASEMSRLGNPTPPHTPTPPVTTSSHMLQPSELHSHMTAAGLHMRHLGQPSMMVSPHAHHGIHPNDLSAFVRQQMIYAVSHPQYANMHPELRAQQEAQARAAAIGMASRFGFPAMAAAATPPINFRQPAEPRLPHPSSAETKSDLKPTVEPAKVPADRLTDSNHHHHGKSLKQDKSAGMISSEIKRHEDIENERHHAGLIDSKHVGPGPPPPLSSGSLRPHVPYPTPVRQLSPHLSVSPHERITDSPAVANLYAQGQMRAAAAAAVASHHLQDHKIDLSRQQPPLPLPLQMQSHGGVKQAPHDEPEMKPPAAHQNPPSTIPMYTFEPSHKQMTMDRLQNSGVLALKKEPIGNLPNVAQLGFGPADMHQMSSENIHHKNIGHGGKGGVFQGHLAAAAANSAVSLNLSSSSHSALPGASFPGLPSSSAVMESRRGSLSVQQTGSEAMVHHPSPARAIHQPSGVQRVQPQTPPHASQVPAQGDSFLLQRYPVMWQGLLALKNDQAAVQMHFVSGNPRIAQLSLPAMSDSGTPPVRIAQRMRLEQTQLEGVARKMQMVDEHCILLALPCGRDHMDVLQQSNNLRNGFISYLQLKQAAGIVNAAAPGSQQPAYVIHIFPSCDFSDENMARIAPDLLHSVSDIAHLLIIIATV